MRIYKGKGFKQQNQDKIDRTAFIFVILMNIVSIIYIPLIDPCANTLVNKKSKRVTKPNIRCL